MGVKFTNNAFTTLSSGISAGATSFSVASVSTFPSLGVGDHMYVSITDEVVKVTAISGTTLTCVATSGAHSAGVPVELRMTAELLNDFAEDTEALPLAGGQMSGNITMAGSQTVDGRDLSADGTKLDGIEANATADQTAAQIKTHLENGIDSVHYVDGSIDAEHIASNAVTTAKIANDAVTEAKLNLISTGSVPSLEAKGTSGVTDGYIQLNCAENSHGIRLKSPPHSAGADYTLTFPDDDGAANEVLLTNGSGVLDWTTVGTSSLAATSVTTAKIASGAVTTTKIGADAVTGAKIADDAIDSEHIAADSIDAEHYAPGSVDTTALAADSVTTAKIADNVTLGGNVTVSGNLTVSGTETTVNTATLAVEDPLVSLATGNNGSDAIDIGIYGLYDTSGSQDLYSGLFRDASDSGKWKLFKDNQAAPTTTVNTSGTGYAVGTLVANLEGNVTGALTGNAATATKLATARSFTTTGDVVITSTNFDGSANFTAAATIQTGAVEHAMLAGDAVDGDNIADDSVNSEHYVDGSIDNAHIASATITGAKLVNNTLTATQIAANAITASELADNAVDTAAIAADAVTGAKIADDTINSEHYVDGSIDTAHIAGDAVTSAKIANGAISSSAKIANDVIDSQHYADGSIDHAHLANSAVDSAKIADGAIDLVHMSSESVDEDNLHISNAGTNGYFLQKQSGNAGGLTWAEVPEGEDYIPNGSVMVFFQANAPTGWTKVTTQNDKTLRVVSGTGGGTGGDWAMSAGETTSSHGGHVHAGAAHTHSHNLAAGAHTLSTSQLASHNHQMSNVVHNSVNPGPFSPGGTAFVRMGFNRLNPANGAVVSSQSTGGGSSHSHSTSGSISSGGDGNTSSAGSHTHTIAAPQYIDVIICSKDA